MLAVSEAQALVLQHVRALAPESVSLAPTSLGLVLAEDVAADIDMPPYTKALMDGYAVRAADLVGGSGLLEVIEEVTAGRTPQHRVGHGQATHIMTGAPMPEGADAVVMIEQSKLVDPGRVQIDAGSVSGGQNVLPRGRE